MIYQKNINKEKITILANNQSLFWTQELKKYLLRKYKIVSKCIGIDKSTKNMKDFYLEPYLLDYFSTAYLYQIQNELIQEKSISQSIKNQLINIINSIQFKVYKTLKLKYFLIDGHKFGSQFLAYEKDPQKNHAKYLIFCNQEDKHDDKIQINHLTRLAQIAKKQCLYTTYNQFGQLKFIHLKRQKAQNKVKNQQKQTNYISKIVTELQNL